jgi:hypothetical protein
MLPCIIRVFLGAGDDCTNTHDRVFQRHQILLAGIPENGWVGIVVIVPKNVADTGDCAPGDVRFINLKAPREGGGWLPIKSQDFVQQAAEYVDPRETSRSRTLQYPPRCWR